MKWLIAVVLSAAFLGLPNDIAKINRLKSEARKSYQAGDYLAAIEKYSMLIDSFKVNEEEILMNYANAAFLLTRNDQGPTQGVEGPQSTASDISTDQQENFQSLAQNTYAGLAQGASGELSSQAFNQLGVMAFENAAPQPPKDVLVQAQGLFKSALKTNPNNQQARFNYELVTKLLDQDQQNQQEQQDQKQEQEQEQDQQQQQEQEQQQQQDQQQQDQQQQDQQQQQQSGEENQDQQGEKENSEEQQGDLENSEQQQSEEQEGKEPQQQELNASPDKMEELKISEEKARMILEAMKNSEVQYIQQNQKKTAKRPESGKPDW